MSAVRRPCIIENCHIFLEGLCENTFNMYVDCSTKTKIEIIFHKTDRHSKDIERQSS